MGNADEQGLNQDDDRWMRRALELAAMGLGNTRPNPCVGAVIVAPDGSKIGEGYHHKAGHPHAEVEALNDAATQGKDVRGATMYVTLEPCNHQGRTGPCTEAVIASGIRRVVIAARDPNVKARGGVERLREARLQVDHGLLAGESRVLNAPFFTMHELGRPLVTLKWAMTLDGCTSTESGDSKWITGPEARLEVHRRRIAHDAILVGINTLLKDNARLTARDVPVPLGPPLIRIVLDTDLRMPLDAAYIHEQTKSPALVVCADDANRGREDLLRENGVEILRVKRGDSGVSVLDLMVHLRARNIQSVYVEGGRTVAGQFMRYGLVDRVESWIAPKISGADATHLGPVMRTPALEKMSDAIALSSLKVSQFGPDILLEAWMADAIKRLDNK